MTTFQIATCSFKQFRPDHGVPISTAVKPPRSWPWSEVCKSLTPYGVFGKHRDFAPYRIAYEDRLNAKQHLLDSELRDLSHKYPGVTLVMLCFCDLSKPDTWCHRRMAAEWLERRYSIVIPELSARSRIATDLHTTQVSLFD